ncbi:MAG: M48 family metalloprotease [Lentisphaeria bacterium]|nr:M48 family metalloprotease [Lentisphaeria bacterium]
MTTQPRLEAPRIAGEEIRANFVKSVILIVILVAIVIGLSLWIGAELQDRDTGLIIGLVVTLVVIPVQILTAKLVILGMARGRKADPEDLRERRAIHIVEGLAVSAGLSRTPPLYIIPSDVPNAFASGMGEGDAFVAVTAGLLNMMDDQELEGVIGHEIGHIVHRDIMLNQLVVGLISTILILAFILERILLTKALTGGNRRSRNDNGSAGAAILILILAAILIRPLAGLISQLLQMAISRKREFAADAYSVQVCSYSEGLARALEKLDRDSHPYSSEEKESLGGSKLAAMYINFPGETLFSTHPPIAERVRRIRNTF